MTPALTTQFIVTEWFKSWQLLEELYAQRTNFSIDNPEFLQERENTRKLRTLETAVARLIGYPISPTPFLFGSQQGRLQKLEALSTQMTLPPQLPLALERIKRLGQQLQALLSYVQTLFPHFVFPETAPQECDEKGIAFSTIGYFLTKLYRAGQEVSEILLHLAEQFTEDESFLYFLVHSKKQWESVWGEGFLVPWIDRHFPAGKAGLTALLTSRYHERGFESLLGLIEAEVEAL